MSGRVFGYGRVSTAEQMKGHSPDAQRAMLEQCFEARGYEAQGLTFGGVFLDEGVRATKPMRDRKAGGQLFLLLARGDVLLLPKLDRGFRNVLDFVSTCQELHDRGVSVVCLDVNMEFGGSDPMAEMLLGILAVFAQFERTINGRRVKEAIESGRAMGYYPCGNAPYGYKKVAVLGTRRKKIVIDQAEVDLFAEIAYLKTELGLLSQEICDRLNAEGKKLRGRPWRSASHVREVMTYARRGVLSELKGDKSYAVPVRGRPVARHGGVQSGGAGVRPLPLGPHDPPPGGEGQGGGPAGPGPDAGPA